MDVTLYEVSRQLQQFNIQPSSGVYHSIIITCIILLAMGY